jgi:hypothetical protein
MQENQWPRNPVLTFWQSKRIYSDNAHRSRSRTSIVRFDLTLAPVNCKIAATITAMANTKNTAVYAIYHMA